MTDWGVPSGTGTIDDHNTRHENGGADEISVVGLSGLLADDQHVLDAEVTAVAVARALFDAQTILHATADDTPVALTVGEQSVVGRVTGGNIVALTGAQLWTILTGQAAAAVSMNSQNLSSVGTIASGIITLPGIYFNDVNTRIDIPAANTLRAYTSNVAAFQINASGAIGLGRFAATATLVTNFEVSGAVGYVANIALYEATKGGEIVLGTVLASATTWHIDNDTGDGGTPGSKIRIFSQPNFSAAGTVYLTIDATDTTWSNTLHSGIVTKDATDIEIGAAGGIKSGATNGDTFLLKANDTTFITLTTGATDTCAIANATITTPVLASLYQASGGGLISVPASAGADTICLLAASQELDNKTLDSSVGKGTWTASGTWTLPAFTLGGTVSINSQKFSGVAIFGAAAPAGGSGNLNSVVAATGTSGVFSDNTNSEFYIRHPSSGIVKLDTDLGNSIQVAQGGTAYLTMSSAGIDLASGTVLKVNSVQVVGARVVDARCDDAINSGDATTDGVIDALRDAMISHGLISAA